MNEDRKIPIVVGAVGHRDITKEESERLRKEVRDYLCGIRRRYPHSPFILLTNLAEGADQICAEAALEEGCRLTAVLPMEPDEYKKDFQGEALERFQTLLSSASEVFTAPRTEPVSNGRDYLYRQAGIYVADHSQILLAVWDGSPAKPGGCGTAEIVDLKINGNLQDPFKDRLRPASGTVVQFPAMRASGSDTPETGSVVIHGEEVLCRKILKQTDLFNQDVETEETFTDLPEEKDDPVMERIRKVYGAADSISVRQAKKYKRILASISIAATLLTIAFLLYDEMMLYWMILLCGIMLLFLFLINSLSKKLQCHRKYLEYRVLAEGLRVQFYLRMAGCSAEVSDHVPFAFRTDLPWTVSAFSALTVGPEPSDPKDVKDAWIRAQRVYHEKALELTRKKDKRNGRIVKCALIIAIIAYLAVVVFELFFGGIILRSALFSDQGLDLCRTILKILVGALSGLTLFAANYYGKLSLDETIGDHERMILLFKLAEQENDLVLLAREELAENRRWYAYQSMNKPEISL